MTVTTRIRSPGRARNKPLKPLRGECRVYSGVPVVTTLVCFVLFRTRGCGCIGHPAFPAPSILLGGWFLQNSGASRRGNAESYLKWIDVIARSKATKQSSFLFAAPNLDCFAEHVIGRAFARPVGSQ